MKTPISYYGGKQRMASKIVPLIPKHTVYVEPFAGGAAVMFAKPWPKVTNKHHYREVINDIDSRLVNFYRVLRDIKDGPILVRMLELTSYSREEHRAAKEHDYGSCSISDAWAYYVNIQQSFANVLQAGWKVGKYGRNMATTWASKTSNLGEYVDRMASVHVEQNEALEVIKQWDSPQTFFYCDPPYPGADQGHYSGYTHEDFAALVSTLDACEGSFILSNYDQPGVSDHWERFAFSATTRGAKDSTTNQKRTEIVWRRFSKVAPRPEILKLWESDRFDCYVKTPWENT